MQQSPLLFLFPKISFRRPGILPYTAIVGSIFGDKIENYASRLTLQVPAVSQRTNDIFSHMTV